MKSSERFDLTKKCVVLLFIIGVISTVDYNLHIDLKYLIWNFLFRYPTCFVIGIMLILIVFAFWGYKTFYRNVRTESITPVRSADTNHYEMKNTNTVLASSGNGHGVD